MQKHWTGSKVFTNVLVGVVWREMMDEVQGSFINCTDHKTYLHGNRGQWNKVSSRLFFKDLLGSTGEHLRLQRRGQKLAFDVGVNGRRSRSRHRRCRPAGGRSLCLCGETVKDALHLLLHFIRPVDEVALQLARFLYDPLLPFPEPGQHLQPFVDLSESSAAWGAGRRSGSLRPVWGCLAWHVELKFLWTEVQGLAVELLDEGHCTALEQRRQSIQQCTSIGCCPNTAAAAAPFTK